MMRRFLLEVNGGRVLVHTTAPLDRPGADRSGSMHENPAPIYFEQENVSIILGSDLTKTFREVTDDRVRQA